MELLLKSNRWYPWNVTGNLHSAILLGLSSRVRFGAVSGARCRWMHHAPWNAHRILAFAPKACSQGEGNTRHSAMKSTLGGGFKYFLFSPLLGEMIQFDSCFSDGLKPPTRHSLTGYTLPETNSNSHLKIDGWKTIFTFPFGMVSWEVRSELLVFGGSVFRTKHR